MTNDTEIDDNRHLSDFKGVTFSNFKKTDAKKALLLSLYNSKIEPACYWSSEYICAGHYDDLWSIIIDFYTKYIHIGNPKILIYLELRLNCYMDILNNGYLEMKLELRNNHKIRKLFCEIIYILCEAKRRHSLGQIKIKEEDYDLTQMTERFKASDTTFANNIFSEDDPKELFIAVNELAYNLSLENKNNINACYWLEWIITFEHKCKQRKEPLQCDRRSFANVMSKFQNDIIWIIWDVFIQESNIRNNKLIKRIISSALNIFCFNYTSACFKKRRLTLYFIIEILTEPFSTKDEIVENKHKLQFISDNVHEIYKQIKINEIPTGTDYLFDNGKASNLQQSIDRINAMNNLGVEYIQNSN